MINEAIKIAKKIKDNKHRLVAIITDKRDKILSIGLNNYNKTHPKQAYYAKKMGDKHKIYLHAEMDALIKCNHKAHNIYIARVNFKGEPVLAKPCKICMSAIKDMKIRNIYYTKKG